MWPFSKNKPADKSDGLAGQPQSPYIAGPGIDCQPKIEIKSIPERTPQFGRHYTTDIRGRKMEIRISHSYGMMMYFGELTQADGRWVTFDPERVADKILDWSLVPLIEARIAEIFAMDRAFRASNPSEFVDEKGQKWKRED